MASSIIRLKDTGTRTVTGSVVYSNPVNSGSWTDLDGFRLTGEFTVNTSNNNAIRNDSTDSGFLTFKANEVTGVAPPRFTLQGIVSATDTTLIQNIIKFGRSKGVKRISGGNGLIASLPEVATDTYQYVSVIIKNITITAAESVDTERLNFTIQLEQVQ